jgi:hypothetical protein
MPKRKTNPETEVSAPHVTESTGKTSRKGTAAPQSASSAAPHKHTRKAAKPTEMAVGTPVAAQEVTAEVYRAVTREDVALLAYSYWEARNFQSGSPEGDWLRAERELKFLA